MRVALAILGALLVALFVLVFVSVLGGGTRPAVGVAAKARAVSGSIVYYSGGAGETVVLLASWARPASDFNEVALALQRGGFRTLAVESRGIGGSEGGGPFATTTLVDLAGDVAAVLVTEGIEDGERIHIVGHAFGNRVARTFAALHPTRTRSVALVAAGGRQRLPEPLVRALFVSASSFLPWSLREDAMRHAFFAEESEIPAYWRGGWWLWGGLSQDHAARTGDSAQFWRAGTAPMLVFQGEEDRIAPPELAGRALRAQFPDRVTLVSVPRAGHALLPEQPDLIAEHLLPYLRRRSDGSPPTP